MRNGTTCSTDALTFKKEGYGIWRNILSSEEVARARDALERILCDQCKPNPDGTIPSSRRPERQWENHLQDQFWMDLCCHPGILDAVGSILGDDVLLLMSGLFVKPPFDGEAIVWHQDNAYWPGVRGSDIVTVWLAIDDVDLENGCMRMLPRSHIDRTRLPTTEIEGAVLKKRVSVSADLEKNVIAIELGAGDISIHDSFILHSSAANTSPRRRAGYTMRYANATTVTVDTNRHHVPVFKVRGECRRYAGLARVIDARKRTS
jgi:phytanoyl-CoA hydroxylase